MILLQKITSPTVRILGTEYSARIVGLHNRLRAHARRLHVYKDILKLSRPAGAATRGAFVAGRKRLVIYLRRGAPELTVAHELVHALLYTEGFLPLRCLTGDLARTPAVALLAQALNDLLVHPVVLGRLHRAGFAPESSAPSSSKERIRRDPSLPRAAGEARAVPERGGAAAESQALTLLARTVGAAEAIHRAADSRLRPLREDLGRSHPELWKLAREVSAAALWNPRRTPADARVRAASILARLDRAGAEIWGLTLSLRERILMPAHLTRRRLAAEAASIFDVRQDGRSGETVLVIFRFDGTACSARTYASPEAATRVAAAVRREMENMTAAQFAERHRLEFLLLEGGRRCRPAGGGHLTA